ncbi:MAG: PaaI family thioesterase [Actinomycetota bacterium]
MTAQDFGGIEGPFAARMEEAIAHQDTIFANSSPGNLGVHVIEASEGRAVGLLEVDERVKHPGGFAHGGALAGFGDTVAAWATFPSLAEGEIFTTIEFKTNFISAVTDGRLRAEAKAIHKGGRTMVIEVRITTDDSEQRLVAMMIVTQAILQGKA